MEIKKENGRVTTTMSFSECFYGFDDSSLSNEILDRFNEIVSYPYRPDRLSPKGVLINVSDSQD